MRKTIEHNGKTFSLELKLNSVVEKHIGGKRIHFLSCNESTDQGPYSNVWQIDHDKMKDQIEAAEAEIKAYADGKKLTIEEEIAAELGFC